MRSRAIWLAPALILAHLLHAQDSRPESRDDAAAALAALDARIHSAEREGLTSVSFSYRPTASGAVETVPFRVHVRWEKGRRETIEFQQPDGSPFADLPDLLKQPAPKTGGPSTKEAFEQGARALLALFRGVPYSEQFRDWYKRLQIGVVNAREERVIVLEPPAARYLSKVEIALDRRDLPWRIVSYLLHPESSGDRIVDRMIEEPTWEEFDGKLVVKGFKKKRGAGEEQIQINWQRVDGFIVPASYERLLPGKPPTKIVFEDVKVGR